MASVGDGEVLEGLQGLRVLVLEEGDMVLD